MRFGKKVKVEIKATASEHNKEQVAAAMAGLGDLFDKYNKKGSEEMAIKIIIGRANKKYRKCLRCKKQIEEALKDNVIYTCEHCGQQHFVDIYGGNIALTVVEHPYARRRPCGLLTPEQQEARRRLIEKVEARKRGAEP